MTQALTTYQVASLQQVTAARRLACEEIAQLWENSERMAKQVAREEIAIFNSLRAVGEQLNLASGRDQLTFTLEGREFFRDALSPMLPLSLTVNAAKACVHISRTYPKDIETNEELQAAKRELQMCWEALGVGKAPQRKELDSPRPEPNHWCAMVDKVACLRLALEKLEEESKVGAWPKDRVVETLDALAPILAWVDKAKAVLPNQ